MLENTTLIAIDKFITDHTRFIRGRNVITDRDAAELFETDLQTVHNLVNCNTELFNPDHILILTARETINDNITEYAFTEQGLFNLAGLLKTKRAIRVYVSLIQVMVNRLQGNAGRLISSLYEKNTN